MNPIENRYTIPTKKMGNGPGRHPIDWDALKIRWMDQKEFSTIESFLQAYGIMHDSAKAVKNTKRWPKKIPIESEWIDKLNDQFEEREQELLDERDKAILDGTSYKRPKKKKTKKKIAEDEFKDLIVAEKLDEERYQAHLRKVWAKIKTWRLKQCEKDHETAEKLRKLIEKQLDLLEQRAETGIQNKTHELISLGRALETVQRIQRLALGLSTDNIGVEDNHKTSDNNTISVAEAGDTPIFAVEVNDKGKFTTLKPRQIN